MISTSDTDFKGILKNNETAAFIVKCLKENTMESSVVEKLILEHPNADKETVACDISEIIGKLRSIGAIAE